MLKFNFYHNRKDNFYSNKVERETAGLIGYIRGDFGSGGNSFHHSWFENKGKIELPLVYKSCKQNVGKKVIYSLEEDSIKLIMDNVDDDKIFNYFKEEGIETIYIILDNFVELNSLAMKTLRLRNRDIVELCIDEEIFALIVK